jgi:hypothetical protein
LSLALDRDELMRYLGYPQGRMPSRELMERVERVVEQGIGVLQPRGTYSVHTVAARGPSWLTLDGVTIAGNVGEYLGSSARIAAFVVTVGDPIARLAREHCAGGDALDGWICDALGSYAAEATADTLMGRLHAQLGAIETLTLRYSPGYCGMDMSQQTPLFELMHPEAIGVSLLPSQFMHPAKSISGLVGMGPAAAQPWSSPCDRCGQTRCHMRRQSARAAGAGSGSEPR